MLAWPWKRFEKFYEAFAKRQIAEELTQRKLLLISAFYANTNYDNPEVNRDDMIRKLEEQFADLINNIYAPLIDIGQQGADDDVLNTDFFAAMKIDGEYLVGAEEA